jgi:Bacterial capsule synthesis protein PGA_cap
LRPGAVFESEMSEPTSIPNWQFTPGPPARRPSRVAALAALAIAVATVILIVSQTGSPGASADTEAHATAPPANAPHASRRSARPAHARSRASISLNWVGDIAISTELGLPAHGLQRALAPVSPLLHDADLTLGNLEGTLSVGGGSKCGAAPLQHCFAFQAPPSTAGDLRALGFGLVNQANNHALDYGPDGQQQTLAALREYGLPYTGLPGQIAVLPVHGVRVAFLGFAPYHYTGDLLDIPGAVSLIHQARREAQIVVVIIHAGAEGSDQVHTPSGEEVFLGEGRGRTRAFAHAAIDAGASLVLGSGPHVPRAVEAYHGHLIAYSLGNFFGYRTLGSGGPLSLSGVLHVTLAPSGALLAARWDSVVLDGGLPRPDPTAAAAKLVATLSAEDFPSDHFVIDDRGGFHA